jgi:hypothetical protein
MPHPEQTARQRAPAHKVAVFFIPHAEFQRRFRIRAIRALRRFWPLEATRGRTGRFFTANRKKTFLAPDHPLSDRFARLTA